MGSTPKTLRRLMDLAGRGNLAPGAKICDIGATQLFGDREQRGIRDFLDFFAARTPRARRAQDVPEETLATIAADGFLGDLLVLAGFDYTALDIFHATNTILFDLNVHEPGPALAGQFDLVLNLGTTEHVFNQLRAHQSIHALMKVGGLCYHDLPMAGYPNHALYRYDPLFFSTMVDANRYQLLLHEITVGAVHPVPDDLVRLGYRVEGVTDVGIEAIVRRTGPEAFRLPMEMGTSLSIDPNFGSVGQSDHVLMPDGMAVHYGGLPFDTVTFGELSRIWVTRLKRGIKRHFSRLG